MKNSITLFFTLFTFISFVQAQTYNSKPGYLVTATGDTLRGMIRDRLDIRESVVFKAAAEADFKTYTPDEIPAFYMENGFYYEAKVMESKKVFLQLLAKGTLGLYQEYNETVFYLEKKDGTLLKLEKKDVVEGSVYKTDNRYRNLLNALTVDCPDSRKSIERANFSNRDLQRVVEEYNNCINPNGATKVFKASSKLKVKAGAKAGLFSNKMKFLTESSVYLGNSSSTETAFSGGIFARLYFKEKWALQPEVLYTKKSGTVDARTVFGTGDIGVFSFRYLQVPVSIYYTFPTTKIKPFVFGGMVIGLPLSTEAYRIKDDEQLPLSFSLDEDELGFRGGAGVQWNLNASFALQLEYLYESTLVNRLSVVNKIGNVGHCVKLGVLF